MNNYQGWADRVKRRVGRAETRLTCFFNQHDLFCHVVDSGFQFICYRCGEPYSPTLPDRLKQLRNITVQLRTRFNKLPIVKRVRQLPWEYYTRVLIALLSKTSMALRWLGLQILKAYDKNKKHLPH